MRDYLVSIGCASVDQLNVAAELGHRHGEVEQSKGRTLIVRCKYPDEFLRFCWEEGMPVFSFRWLNISRQ